MEVKYKKRGLFAKIKFAAIPKSKTDKPPAFSSSIPPDWSGLKDVMDAYFRACAKHINGQTILYDRFKPVMKREPSLWQKARVKPKVTYTLEEFAEKVERGEL